MTIQQLSGMDSLFVRCELGNTYLHIGPLLIYSPSTRGGAAPGFKFILNLFEQRLSHSGVFRRKLVEVPWKLDNPYWVEDPDFELKNHVVRTRLRKPGNLRQFLKEVGRIHSRPLDRDRPLWMAHVIYGLNDVAGLPADSFAIYFKTHHASMDGATGEGLIEAIHDFVPNATREESFDDWKAEREPSSIGLLSLALVNNIQKPFKMVGVARQALPGVKRLVQGVVKKKPGGLSIKEKTRFNHSVGPDRVVGFVTLSLAEVKEARKLASGATVNDVILTVVAGAMRSYLEAKGELPDKPLVAGVPVNVRSDQHQGTGGNVISLMEVSLSTDIKNPLKRLKGVHQQTRSAKNKKDGLGPDFVINLTDSLPQFFVALLTRPVFSAGLLGKIPPIVNTAVTNVPGPGKPLYLGDAKMENIIGLGPCADGLGLFHSVSSYCDVITIGFQACPTMLPDPEIYTSCLQESWDDLLTNS